MQKQFKYIHFCSILILLETHEILCEDNEKEKY